MAKVLTEFVQRNPPASFDKEAVIFNEAGDFLTVYFSDDDSYTRRIDDLLTVYYSEASDELVGCKIKGVRQLLDQLGTLGVSVDSKGVSVWLLIAAGSFDDEEFDPDLFRQYRLIKEKTLPVKFDRAKLATTI